MGLELLTERYAAAIAGTLSCFDRVLIFGTLPNICYAEGMTSYLLKHQIRIFDYLLFASRQRDELRANAELLATEAGLKIDFIRRHNFRKEDRVQEILARRGQQPGLVHIFSALESCPAYAPRHDKQTGSNFIRPDSGKCLHYYFYFIDEELGLCHVRVPTWLPCRLQVYFNGHNWLAGQLSAQKIDCTLLDNAFAGIGDWEQAQRIADQFDPRMLHRKLDEFASRFCPIHRNLGVNYHWSVDQCEYATDIVFRKRADLQPLYENLSRTAIQTVKPDNIATFLGRKLDPRYQGEVGNRFNVRIEGTRIKHSMGPVSLKLYDKAGLILRIETTVNDLNFFKHYREVEHRDGTREAKQAPMQKTIHSLPALRQLLARANHRYLEFLSAIEDPRSGRDKLDKLSQTQRHQGRSYPGFNFFDRGDEALFRAIARGEFNISGMQNKTLRRLLSGKTSAQVSRLLKRLRLHGLIRKAGSTYKYYLTQFGKQVISTGLKLRELVIIPQLAFAQTG